MEKPRLQVKGQPGQLKPGNTRNQARVVDVLPVDPDCSNNLGHPAQHRILELCF